MISVFSKRQLIELPVIVVVAVCLVMSGALAGEQSLRTVMSKLFSASREQPIDLSSQDLSGFDLSKTDFKAARLQRANLFGADLTDADLSETSLVGAKLDRTTILRTNFNGADLSEASLLLPATYQNEATSSRDAPTFQHSKLLRSRVTGLYIAVNFKGANLTEADLSSPSKNYGDHSNPNTKRTTCRSCDFSNSTLVRANLTHTSLQFSRFVSADFTGADLSYADFSRANLAGANFTGARLVGTSFEGANLEGATGIGSCCAN